MKPSTVGRFAALAVALLLCAPHAIRGSEGSGTRGARQVPLAAPDRELSGLSASPVRFSGLDPVRGDEGALVDLPSAGYDAHAALASAQREPARPSLMKLYRDALMQETRRSMRRDPSLFWVESFDTTAGADIHEGFTMNRARRSAEKIFGEAHQELLAGMVNHLIETSAPLNALNSRIRGFDFNVRAASSRSEIAPFDSDAAPRSDRHSATNFSFVVSNNPRLAMETRLPGRIKASVEVPLRSPGFRTTFSRPFTAGMRGTLSFGVEDMGEEYWVSAGVRCGF